MNEDKQIIAVRKALLGFNPISIKLSVFLSYIMKKKIKIKLSFKEEL